MDFNRRVAASIFFALVVPGCNCGGEEGVAPAKGALSLSPANVDFGTVRVGSTVTQTITLTNDGGGVLTLCPTTGERAASWRLPA